MGSFGAVDIGDPRAYARSFLNFTGDILAGIDAFGPLSPVYNGGQNDTTGTTMDVEPKSYTDGLLSNMRVSLDALQRLYIFTSFDSNGNTFLPANASFTVQWTRDAGVTWVDHPTTLLTPFVSTNGDNTCRRHEVVERFPANFMQNAAAAVDINDHLAARMKINASTASTPLLADVTLTALVLLVPGIVSSANKKPRGAVFSDAGVDY